MNNRSSQHFDQWYWAGLLISLITCSETAVPIRIGSISLYFPDCMFGEDRSRLTVGCETISVPARTWRNHNIVHVQVTIFVTCLNFVGTGSRISLPAVSSCRRVKPSRKIALNSNVEVNCRKLARRPWFRPGGALTLERGMGMCRGHDHLFSGWSPLSSPPIYPQCAALVPPVLIFRKFLHFQPCFGQNSSSLDPNFSKFLFSRPPFFQENPLPRPYIFKPAWHTPTKKSWVPPRGSDQPYQAESDGCGHDVVWLDLSVRYWG